MTNAKAVFEQLLHCKAIVTDEDVYYYAVPYDVYKDICNVLKEQEAVDPIKMLDGSWSYECCGACRKPLYERGFAYCPWCGRAVKWE